MKSKSPISNMEDMNNIFSRFSLVALGRNPKKPHFHEPIKAVNKRRGQKELMKIFLNFTSLPITQSGQKLLEISRTFWKKSTMQMFAYPGVDAA